MIITVIPNDEFKSPWCAHTNLSIGDMVRIKDTTLIWPSFQNAFKELWGQKTDGFHDLYGQKVVDYNEGVYGNLWTIIKFTCHPWYSHIILCHLKDYCGRDILVNLSGLELVKKRASDNCSDIVVRQMSK